MRNSRNMVRVAILTLGTVCLSANPAEAFFEEGNDDLFRPGYAQCRTEGDLLDADLTGCNPWPDRDSSYSYKGLRDIKKSSLHYNATAALAVAAGFDRCAAQLIAIYAEATDVGTDYDLEFWVPWLEGNSAEICGALATEEGAKLVDGLVLPGLLVAPDFTFRSFSRNQANEIVRESFSFHWNHTLSSLSARGSVECSLDTTDPLPVPPKDVLTLGLLRQWTQGENTLNACPYDPGNDIHGPIAHYHPEQDVKPGSLGSMGVFLHALQDSYSHRVCGGNTHNFGFNTTSPCGFSSGHYAGEFGAMPDGRPGTGIVDVTTPARSRPYKVSLHSDQTVLAMQHTFEVLKTYLAENPQHSRGAEACAPEQVTAFALKFAAIPNVVPAPGAPSGARWRSDFADAFFVSDACGEGLVESWPVLP